MSDESARIAGVGGRNNYIARQGDPHAWLANPAASAPANNGQIIATYGEKYEGDLTGGTVALTLKNCGIKIDSASVSDIESRDSQGEVTATSDLTDMNVSAVYGMQFTQKLALGAGLNILDRNYEDTYRGGLSLGFGAIYKASERVSLGAVVENIGVQSSLDHNTGTVAAPLTVRAGGQLSIVDDLYLMAGGSKTVKEVATYNFGAEYHLYKAIALRAGYDSGRRSYGPISAGVGINIQDILNLDYAYNSHPELGASGIFTVTFKAL